MTIGSNQNNLILMSLTISTNARNDSTNLLPRNFPKKTKVACQLFTCNLQCYQKLNTNFLQSPSELVSWGYFVYFFLCDSLIFFLIMPNKRACAICLGINSSLAMTPLPSMERGEMRKVAPLNIISGNFTSTSCVMANLIVLPYNALDTSSMGVSGIAA